uniref:Uncharacterized protein n=1 Tax=Oryza barthii TaxID=65489 RepID=A0A0D3ER51_9ORYZ
MGGRGLTQLPAGRRGVWTRPRWAPTLLDVSLVMRLSARTSSSRRSTSGCGRPSSRRARLRRARQRPTTLTRHSRRRDYIISVLNKERGGCGEPSFNTCRGGQTLLGQSLHDRGLKHS